MRSKNGKKVMTTITMPRKKDRKNRLSNDKIGSRICKDIGIGLVVSTLLCIVLSKYYDYFCEWISTAGFTLPEFNYQDIFCTELSIAFLVISFVTLLANKTEIVYWVDVIQYRLVKPNHTSIVDISSYIFANIIISLFAYLIPPLNSLLVFSFVQVIFLLGMLSLKLLMAFFGVEDLKRELENEYKMALDFRKTVVSLYYCDDGADIFYSWKDIPFTIVASFFEEPPPLTDDYADISVLNFNENAPMADKNFSVQQLYQHIITGKKRPKITHLHILKLYIKLRRYSVKFNGNVSAYAEMKNSLYANTLHCIEQKQIQKSCEQIFFFFKYREYDLALRCMTHALNHCPLIFISEFSFLQMLDISEEKCIRALNEMFVSLKQHPEYKISENSNNLQRAFQYMASISSKFVTAEMLYRQYAQALKENDHVSIESSYRCLVYTKRKRPIEALFIRRTILSTMDLKYLHINHMEDLANGKEKIPQEVYETVEEWFEEDCNQLLDRTNTADDYEWFKLAYEQNDYQAVCSLLQAYKDWLEECNAGLVLGNILENVGDHIAENIKLYCVGACDIFYVYTVTEQMYRDGQLPADIFTVCAHKIIGCYKLMEQWLKDCNDKYAFLQELDSKVLRPCQKIWEDIERDNKTKVLPNKLVRWLWAQRINTIHKTS